MKLKLTKLQLKLLATVADDRNIFTVSPKSGRIATTLKNCGLIQFDVQAANHGRSLTKDGWWALHAAYKARWAKDGCLAYQQDLEEVEVKMKARGLL